ncbi:hypothetical protein CH373_10865 [Leptospira perolatii]|uniref:DUF692 domain-containing protein n=1 Tax=Leptospira perolatii TaxID=2023191 RepID=A0A2M9ZLP4_9LEPT|nr:DUF692 domain-containing protein [Leptospira perolatii]PJZ69787.1 hypothetical protein CH360_09370 [Leptospira perolatii]PJZ72998.1 hypothetical protein CH373_10865 [Leptospira perolatii]
MKGLGVGLRSEHYSEILRSDSVKVNWFEAITENYMDTEGRPIEILEKIRSRFPIALHGVALSLLGGDFPNLKYFERWKKLIQRIEPFLVSDHLCWSSQGGSYLHDLLPFPFTKGFLQLAIERVQYIQEFLKRPILLENVSTYVRFTEDEMTEWEFLTQISKGAGCGILLDINNVFVNSRNHGFDPATYLNQIAWESVMQVHLAGYTDTGEFLFDTHSQPVSQEVRELVGQFSPKIHNLPVLVEWDSDLPNFATLEKEALSIRKLLENGNTKTGQGGLV